VEKKRERETEIKRQRGRKKQKERKTERVIINICLQESFISERVAGGREEHKKARGKPRPGANVKETFFLRQ